MKFNFSFIIAVLAMLPLTSTARQPRWIWKRQDSDSTPTSAPSQDTDLNGTSPLVSNITFDQDYITTMGDLFTNDTVWSTWDDYNPWRANDTSDGQGGIPLDENNQPTKPLVVGIRMGGPKQHVGTRRGQRLYSALYDAIHAACPTWRGKNGCRGEVTDSTATIDHIVYNSGSNTYATNAHLKITVHYGFSNPSFLNLAGLMYETAALAYKLQTERAENCYDVDFAGSRRTRMCNVGQRVGVGMPSNLGHNNLEALLVMDVEFNGKTAEGAWRCDDGLKTDVHERFRKLGYDRKVAESVGVKIDKFQDQEVSCFPKGGKNGESCMQWFEFRGQQCRAPI